MNLTLGSLFSGFGGLDLAVESAFGARTAWVSDIEPGPCKVLAHRWPGVPNLGDVTRIDWTTVQPVDIIAGGSPCQDISTAGRRAGMTEGTRSNLWVEMREAIATLKPAYVIWENVRGATSATAASEMESNPRLLGDHPAGQPVLRALGRVLGDLADLGFDAEWHGLRAADVGAPHGRFRIFVLAAHRDRQRGLIPTRRGLPAVPLPSGNGAAGRARELLPTPAACNPNDGETPETWLARRERVKETANNGNGMGMPLGIAVQLLTTPRATRGGSSTETVEKLLPTPRSQNGEERNATIWARPASEPQNLENALAHTLQDWGQYAAVIARWEAITGPAPAPTKPGRLGRPKLNPAFAEWMMGAPVGWITDTPGVTDNEALRMAGNGVVQQQAEAALRTMLNRSTRRAAA